MNFKGRRYQIYALLSHNDMCSLKRNKNILQNLLNCCLEEWSIRWCKTLLLNNNVISQHIFKLSWKIWKSKICYHPTLHRFVTFYIVSNIGSDTVMVKCILWFHGWECRWLNSAEKGMKQEKRKKKNTWLLLL